MQQVLTSPAGTAVAVVMVVILGIFAVRGVWADTVRTSRRDPPHLYTRFREAKRREEQKHHDA